MAKVFEVYQKALKDGKEKGLLSQDLRLLIAHIQGYNEGIDVLIHQDDELKDQKSFDDGLARLFNDEPIEYIINDATFLNRHLYVDQRVLIPRMETEELVANFTERIDDYFDPRNYLVAADIGTGSGAIALALKSFFPNWIVLASDISSPALEIAKKNIQESGLRINVLEGSSLEPYIEAKMNLDIIISNPPYIVDRSLTQESVKKYEPSSALWLDKEHSVYEDIFRDCHLVKKGSLLMCFEIGSDLEPYLDELMKKYLTDYKAEYMNDLMGRKRFLFVYLA